MKIYEKPNVITIMFEIKDVIASSKLDIDGGNTSFPGSWVNTDVDGESTPFLNSWTNQ